MKIDASRYSLFLTNPEEYRLKYLWNLSPSMAKDAADLSTYGRRRGTAFHEMTDGKDAGDLKHLGDTAVKTASLMHEANQDFGKDTTVIWREKEFNIAIPDSQHRMVGRIDQLVERWDERFILDLKTSKHRTKEDMSRLFDAYRQSPQVDFYLLAVPEVEKFVYRILSKKTVAPSKKNPKPEPVVEIHEIEVYRQKFELAATQRSVDMVCDTIEFWVGAFGIEKPWPRAIALKVAPENYSYSSIYQRSMFEGAEWEGFEKRTEHLDCMKGAL